MTNEQEAEAQVAKRNADTAHVPVTFDHCDHVDGPFYHGTKSSLEVGAQLVPGHGSNYQEGRTSNNIYFSAILETAVWGASWPLRWPDAMSEGTSTWFSPLARSRTTPT